MFEYFLTIFVLLVVYFVNSGGRLLLLLEEVIEERCCSLFVCFLYSYARVCVVLCRRGRSGFCFLSKPSPVNMFIIHRNKFLSVLT